MDVPVRPYYSERKAGIVRKPGYTPRMFRKLVASAIARFEDRGYFQLAFGRDCVDDGYMPGTLGFDTATTLEMHFGERAANLYPPANWGELDLDSVFDLLEFLHDYVAQPTEHTYHSWNDCGFHVSAADSGAGREDWRQELNQHLVRLPEPMRMTDEGRIEFLPTEAGVRELVDEPLSLGNEQDDTKIQRAVRLFLAHGSSSAERREAIRELADVLERNRVLLRSNLLSKDEGDLFNVANN